MCWRSGARPDGVLLFEEMAGLVEVRVDARRPGRVDRRHDRRAAAAVARPGDAGRGGGRLRRAEPDVIVTTAHRPILASVGNPFSIAEVTDAALTRATPRMDRFRAALAPSAGARHALALYLYAAAAQRIRARMFAPLAGTFEDPATGSAATPLGRAAALAAGAAEASYDIVQGVEMGRPSLLRITARRDADGIRGDGGRRLRPGAARRGGCVARECSRGPGKPQESLGAVPVSFHSLAG